MTLPEIPTCPCGIAKDDCDYHKVTVVPYREEDGEETFPLRWNEKEQRWEFVMGGDPCGGGMSGVKVD